MTIYIILLYLFSNLFFKSVFNFNLFRRQWPLLFDARQFQHQSIVRVWGPRRPVSSKFVLKKKDRWISHNLYHMVSAIKYKWKLYFQKKTDHSKIYFILFIPDINIVLPAWGRATIALEVEAPTLTSSASFISLCLGLDNKSLVEELCGNLGLHLWPWSTKIYSPNKLQYKTNCKSCNLS